jgi:hypothetical protein
MSRTEKPLNPIGTLKLNETRGLAYPEKYRGARRLVITFPWAKEVINGRSVQWFYRHKDQGEKPYLPEGYASFKADGGEEELYAVMEADGVTPAQWK